MTVNNAFGFTAFGFPFGVPEPDDIMNEFMPDRAFCYNIRTNAWTSVLLPVIDDPTRAQVSSACEFPVSSQPILSQWSSAKTGLLAMTDGRTETDGTYTFHDDASGWYSDTSITTNFTTASLGERVTWQELHVFWEISETFTAMRAPDSITVTYEYDWGTSTPETVTVSPSSTAKFTRLIVPREARNSTRLRVTITTSDGYIFGIEGLTMIYESEGATETRK